VRYAVDVPVSVAMPLEVRARLRHRSRNLIVQQAVCRDANEPAGKAFLTQAGVQRDMRVDPCAPQPVTEIAKTSVWVGAGWEAKTTSGARAEGHAPEAAWERTYEHGMGLIGVISERLDEPRQVLEHALAQLPDSAEHARARAMVMTQLGSVLGRQGRTDESIAVLEQARALLPAPGPPAIDTIAADALARVWRWEEAERYAAAATKQAPRNTAAWVMLARARGSKHDDAGALEAARAGLVWSPRDPDLLRSQATALAGLAGGENELAKRALAAFDRFRAPDEAAALRIACANKSERCTREREMGHVHVMKSAR
jgi:tetratricopeptide (TPR) repeat protein